MKLTIYQINHERDKNNLSFVRYDSLPHFQNTQEINSSIYDKVYTAEVECKTAEDVYHMFNHNHPKDYRGRSLSVSDVIEIHDAQGTQDGFYFCDSFEFKKIDFDPKLTEISERFVDNSSEKMPGGRLSVLLVEPNKIPRMVEIDDTLEAMQKLVGGYIEEVFMPNQAEPDEAVIICNEESLLLRMPPNRAIYDKDGTMVNAIRGNFFIALAPIGSEKFLSLPRSLAQKYQEKFMRPEMFFRSAEGLVAVPYTPTRGDRER